MLRKVTPSLDELAGEPLPLRIEDRDREVEEILEDRKALNRVEGTIRTAAQSESRFKSRNGAVGMKAAQRTDQAQVSRLLAHPHTPKVIRESERRRGPTEDFLARPAWHATTPSRHHGPRGAHELTAGLRQRPLGDGKPVPLINQKGTQVGKGELEDQKHQEKPPLNEHWGGADGGNEATY